MADDVKQTESRQKIERWLQIAHRLIRATTAHGPALREYEVYAAQGAYEAAWHALASVAQEGQASPGCWFVLSAAARMIGLPEQAADASRRGHERARQDEERFGPDMPLACPVCGTETLAGGSKVWLKIPAGTVLADLRSEIPGEPGPGNTIFTWRCANGHRWKIAGFVLDGVTIFDTWDLLPDA